MWVRHIVCVSKEFWFMLGSAHKKPCHYMAPILEILEIPARLQTVRRSNFNVLNITGDAI